MGRIVWGCIPALCFAIVVGCASGGFNSVQKINQLRPGMQQDEVVALLGEPSASQMTGDKWVLKYSLHEKWKGNVFYYLMFSPDTGALQTWYENEEEYKRNQAQMEQMLKPLLEAQAAADGAAPVGPNDPELQKWITGKYYSFTASAISTGSSERILTLCANGRFTSNFESGYSGSGNRDGTTDWGSATQSGDRGTWTISGNRQSGTVGLTSTNGKTRSMPYRVGSEDQVIYFDGVKYAYAGAASCP